MATLALLVLLCLHPVDAGSALDEVSVDIQEHDFADATAEKSEDNDDEVPDLPHALHAAQRSYDMSVTHAKYSDSLLSFAQQLMQKHAPKLALNGEQVETVLKSDGLLRDAVTEHMNHQQEDANLVEQRAGLLARAGQALEDDHMAQAALLDTTAKGKTPCVHLVENYHNVRLVDFDGPGNGRANMGSARGCQQQCLQTCKNSAFQRRKFIIDQGEMRTMGISQREMNAMQGNQVGAKCDGQRCQCVDATESSQNLRRVFQQYGKIDVSLNENYNNVPDSEYACMSQCRDKFANNMKYEGVCFDELHGY